MATGNVIRVEQRIPDYSKWFVLGNVSSGGSTTVTLPTTGTYLICTAHNSTSGTNTIWLVRGSAGSGSGVWLMGTGNGASSNITATNLGNRQIKFQSSSGGANLYAIQIGG